LIQLTSDTTPALTADGVEWGTQRWELGNSVKIGNVIPGGRRMERSAGDNWSPSSQHDVIMR